jgi:phosphoglycolate phosphatase-like HAD superfamily hydrolase
LRVGIVSNIGRRALAEGLNRFEFAPWVSSVVTRDEVTFMKPRAEGILRLLTVWQVTVSDVLFVGDSRADVFGARAAGVRVAIIRDGECDESAFVDAPPDYMVSARRARRSHRRTLRPAAHGPVTAGNKA